MKRLRISTPAVNDLDNIWNYLADQSIDAADRVESELREAMRKLCEMPGMGHERADVTDKRLRFWNLYSYVIAYRVEYDVLFVVRVVHGKRNIRELFP